MAVKIRLKRIGTRNTPVHRIVVADGRKPRDGTNIEELGIYWPLQEGPENFKLNLDRAEYWLGVGAQPSDTVRSIIRKARRVAQGLSLPEAKPKKKPKPTKEETPAGAEGIVVEEPKEGDSTTEAKAEVPAEEPKADETPVKEPKAENAPAEKALTEEAASAEGKADEVPADEVLTEEAEETPAEETEGEGVPAEEVEAEESPAEDAFAEEAETGGASKAEESAEDDDTSAEEASEDEAKDKPAE